MGPLRLRDVQIKDHIANHVSSLPNGLEDEARRRALPILLPYPAGLVQEAHERIDDGQFIPDLDPREPDIVPGPPHRDGLRADKRLVNFVHPKNRWRDGLGHGDDAPDVFLGGTDEAAEDALISALIVAATDDAEHGVEHRAEVPVLEQRADDVRRAEIDGEAARLLGAEAANVAR